MARFQLVILFSITAYVEFFCEYGFIFINFFGGNCEDIIIGKKVSEL